MNKKTNIYAFAHRHKSLQFLFGCLHSYKPIVDYIDTQFENYLQEELKIKRFLFNYHDTRIHICLYFIPPTGHSLKSLDLVTMKKLDSKVHTNTTYIHISCGLVFLHKKHTLLVLSHCLWITQCCCNPIRAPFHREWCAFRGDVEIPDLFRWGVDSVSSKNKAKRKCCCGRFHFIVWHFRETSDGILWSETIWLLQRKRFRFQTLTAQFLERPAWHEWSNS